MVRAHFFPLLTPNARVLDVGSGKHPYLLPSERPESLHYVGLDADESELALAPEGSYRETLVSDATARIPSLEGRFDVVLCRWLLEHVQPVDAALENFRAYLRPGGRFAAYLAGRRSAGALTSRLLGPRLASAALTRLTDREPENAFPAMYDRCYHGALARMGRSWTRFEILPIYQNAEYLAFARPLQALYLIYEEAIARRDLRDLATHYVILGEA